MYAADRNANSVDTTIAREAGAVVLDVEGNGKTPTHPGRYHLSSGMVR
jgi:hypothetical protein